MSTSNLLPDETAVHELLSNLYGNDVKVQTLEQVIAPEETCVLATYRNDEGKVARVVTCDYSIANRAGAALTMFPAGGADDAISKKSVPENYLENLNEVLNICVNLFTASTASHLVLDSVYSTTDVVNEALTKLDVTTTATFEVDVPRYGSGVLSLSTVDSSDP